MADFDLVVVGGGINGVGIARDAAGRGLKVLLVEQGDLGSGTSSASTKLIHGGLRYLEHYAFHLVRESLAEREVLLKAAPHLVRPMRFVLPIPADSRPPWMLKLGLALYDWFARGSSLPKSSQIDLNNSIAGTPLRRNLFVGLEYSDCAVDDARLVITTAIDAAARGATIRPRTRCLRLDRGDDWTLVLNSRGRRSVVTARVVVNATGPWTAQFSEMVLRQPTNRVRLVKGSHIVVPKLYSHDRAYLFQNRDRRIVFAIPFQRDFTMIGTTDLDFVGDLAALSPSRDEIAYLCEAAGNYFRDVISTGDVVWAFSGVRALYDDGTKAAQDVSREHKLILDTGFHRAPLLSLYGGKLTTYRRVAEEVMEKLAIFFMPRPAWTEHATLPGGDLSGNTLEQFIEIVQREWSFLSEDQAQRLTQAYGNRVDRVLGSAQRIEDLGRDFGHGLTEAEVRYLMREEWAESADDVLWRRTKLGLRFLPQQKEALAQFMASATGDLERV